MKVLKRRDGMYLIILCCVAYAFAYLSRLSYSANITAIGAELGFSQENLGLISSFLFFAYAGGQLMSAALGKVYNPKYMVPLGMVLTSLCNFGMTLTDNITLLKLIWMLNGIAQSLFWCNILNIQAKYISRELMPLCIMLGGFSYCFGTVGIYGISAIFVNFNWRITFYLVSALTFIMAILWFISVSRLEKAEKVEEELPELKVDTPPEEKPAHFFRGRVLLLVGFVSFVAVTNSFIKDGVTNWFPSILKDKFGFDDSLAILTTLGISLLSLLGIYANAFFTKRVRGNLFLQTFYFALIAAVTALAIFAFRSEISIIFIILFGLNVCLLYCNGNTITSVIPFGIRKHGNVGSFSALLDCFCYLGSTLATYLFGLIADNGGWGYVLVMISAVALISALVSFIGSEIARRRELTHSIF